MSCEIGQTIILSYGVRDRAPPHGNFQTHWHVVLKQLNKKTPHSSDCERSSKTRDTHSHHFSPAGNDILFSGRLLTAAAEVYCTNERLVLKCIS